MADDKQVEQKVDHAEEARRVLHERAVDQCFELAKIAHDDEMRVALEHLAHRFSLPPERGTGENQPRLGSVKEARQLELEVVRQALQPLFDVIDSDDGEVPPFQPISDEAQRAFAWLRSRAAALTQPVDDQPGTDTAANALSVDDQPRCGGREIDVGEDHTGERYGSCPGCVACQRVRAATKAVEVWMVHHDLTGYSYRSLAVDVLAAVDHAAQPDCKKDQPQSEDGRYELCACAPEGPVASECVSEGCRESRAHRQEAVPPGGSHPLLSDAAVHELTKQIVEGSDGEVISLPYQAVKDALADVLRTYDQQSEVRGKEGWFQKKPVQAVQCRQDGIPASFLRNDENMHKLGDGSVVIRRNEKGRVAEVAPGDWLIREPSGMLVTCWQRHFTEVYEPLSGWQVAAFGADTSAAASTHPDCKKDQPQSEVLKTVWIIQVRNLLNPKALLCLDAEQARGWEETGATVTPYIPATQQSEVQGNSGGVEEGGSYTLDRNELMREDRLRFAGETGPFGLFAEMDAGAAKAAAEHLETFQEAAERLADALEGEDEVPPQEGPSPIALARAGWQLREALKAWEAARESEPQPSSPPTPEGSSEDR